MIVDKEHLEERKAKTSIPITPAMLLISIYLYNTTQNLKINQTLIPIWVENCSNTQEDVMIL